MCGIWGCLGKEEDVKMFKCFNNIRDRGPERSQFLQWQDWYKLHFGFHRLSIVSTDATDD